MKAMKDYVGISSLVKKAKVTIPNQVSLNQKISQIKGKDFLVAADFDYTLTQRFNPKGGLMESCFGVIEMCDLISKEASQKSRDIYAEYLKIENDFSIDENEKNAILEDFSESNMKTLSEEHLSKADFEQIIKNSEETFLLRCKFDLLWNSLVEHKVPLVVISAGFKDIIEATFRLNMPEFDQHIKNKQLFVIGNEFLFGEDGKTYSCNYEDKVMTYNKDIMYQKLLGNNFEFYKNAVILGDHLGDADIASNVDYETVIKIGFYHYERDSPLWEKYLKKYDVILEGDPDMEYCTKFISDLKECSI